MATAAVDWADITGKPSTFPPTLPIASSGVTGLDTKQASQDTAISGKLDQTAADARYLGLAGGTLTGSFNIDMVSPINYVNGKAASGSLGSWYFSADFSNRWAWGVGSQASGANMFFERYDNAGAWVGYVLQFNRTTGLTSVGAGLSVTGNLGFYGATPVARGALALPTGTIQRTTYATGTVTTPQLAGVVMAMITDLRAMGLFS